MRRSTQPIGPRFGPLGRRNTAHSAGDKVSAFNAEISIATLIVTANCRNRVPEMPQGCPGKSGISESELVLNITRGLRDGWRFVELGDGSAFEQAGAHEVCKAQCQQVRAAIACGDAQQQISNHGGKDLQTNGVFGTAKESADFEMLLDPPKQQLDLPAFAIERGDTAGRALQIVAQDGEQTTILAPQHDAAQP